MVVLALVFGLSACTSAPPPVTSCEQGPVRLILSQTAAPQTSKAPLLACTRQGDAAFTVTVRPESEPINPSPWYAFTVQAASAQRIAVTLDYGSFEHRYWPKLSREACPWRPLGLQDIALAPDRSTARLTLAVEAGQTDIAAQEVLSVEQRFAWLNAFAARHGLTPIEIGQSVEGRPIWALHAGQLRQGAPLLILLGGQHPPEVPGTLGIWAVLDAIFADGTDKDRLLSQYGVLIVPELNPDGVARGHWRHNLGLVDLNRDWGPFGQPETQAVRDEIARLASLGLTPTFLLDFHATRRSVFYTPDSTVKLHPTSLVADWLAGIDAKWEGEMPAESSSHNPAGATAKVWFAKTYAAPAVTVEFGDETDRTELAGFAKASAQALLTVLAAHQAAQKAEQAQGTLTPEPAVPAPLCHKALRPQ
jgi:predicted deacylase